MAKNKDIVSVLAFEKKLVPSDGYLYGTTWENRNKDAQPLELIEKSVRGTISNRLKKELEKDPTKLDAEMEKANLQKVDNCSLMPEADTLKLEFGLKFLSNVEQPSACNHAGFTKTYQEAVKGYIQEKKFEELARRYAHNLANARYLWRNRVGAEEIEVVVKCENPDREETWTFNAKEFDLKNFDTDNPQIEKIAKLIAETLSGEKSYLMLKITAFAKIGTAQEVYPSEELVLDKSSGNVNGKKSKILYAVNKIAALHSQKIGNALRTIDTWYPDCENNDYRPIAIEVYGAVTNMGTAFRKPKNDFYTLFDRFARGEKLEKEEEEHYVMAVLLRGGVFGESNKD